MGQSRVQFGVCRLDYEAAGYQQVRRPEAGEFGEIRVTAVPDRTVQDWTALSIGSDFGIEGAQYVLAAANEILEHHLVEIGHQLGQRGYLHTTRAEGRETTP